jgi:hypothetical protein
MGWCEALTSFLTNVAAGAVVLFLGYLFVERRLQLREQRDRRAQADAANASIRTATLRSVHAELESNASHLRVCIDALRAGDLPTPGFDVTGWSLLSQVEAFLTLKSETITALTHAYNRMNSANTHLDQVADFDRGQTGMLAVLVAAPHIDENPKVAAAFDEIRTMAGHVREGLIARLEDLKGHLDEAIDAVEGELGIAADVPAAQRVYVSESTPARMGGGADA